jgi:hypothetical protein
MGMDALKYKWIHVLNITLFLTRVILIDYGASHSMRRSLAVPAGGKRLGAGRKPGSGWKAKIGALRDETITRMTSIVSADQDPLSVIVGMVMDTELSVELRQSAAGIALPYLYPRLSAMTVDQRTTTVKIDGNALIDKLNLQIERLTEAPNAASIIDAAIADEAEAA